jgi:hypothetical protein
MKTVLFLASAILSLNSFAAKSSKFKIKCDDGNSFNATQLIIGQTMSGDIGPQEFFKFHTENGVQNSLYRQVGYKNITCKVEIGKIDD